MFAIVQIGSSQFKVTEGEVIDVNRQKDESGSEILLDKVLMFAKGTDIRIGQPYLKDVKITAKVVAHNLGNKTVALQYRKRKNSARKTAHRTKLTSLNITQIAA